MSMFSKNNQDAEKRLIEEKFYEQVMDELNAGIKREGLWAKALVLADGDESRAKANYIKLRVQSIFDEKELAGKLAVADSIASYEERVQECAEILYGKGYGLISYKNGSFRINEPLGGIAKKADLEELENYCKSVSSGEFDG